ncbi:MAG: DUF6882 domain-containing protein [Segniliparus sp.]|uniref:DUF6882 domain-containing protein n=1 Tax=Segniliparus sp. TaxID=2804064 RepID=UPI003F31B366
MEGESGMSGEPPAPLPTHPLSRELFDDAILWAWEQQLRLEDVLGGDSPYGKGPWWADPQAGTVTFNHGRRPSLSAKAHFLGSASPGSGVWLWGWANANGFPEPVIDSAARLRVHAESYEHHGLYTPALPLAGHIGELVWRIGAYASYVLDLPCYLFDGGGSVGALLVEHPLFELREPTPFRTAQVVNRALDAGLVSDWPRALATYAEKRGVGLEQNEAGYVLLPPKGGAVTVELDAQGRVGLVDIRAS